MPLHRAVSALIAAALLWSTVAPVLTPSTRDNVSRVVAVHDGTRALAPSDAGRLGDAAPRTVAGDGGALFAKRGIAGDATSSVTCVLRWTAQGVRAGELLAFAYDATPPPSPLVS